MKGYPGGVTWLCLAQCGGVRVFTLILAIVLAGCSGEQTTELVGPVPLKSGGQMKAFLSDNRFDAVGTQERGDSWWFFKDDGSFEARHDGTHLRGRWAASITELSLTALELATDGGRAQAVPDRKCRLEWQDGKMNINIDGRQYRNYGGKLQFPR